MEGRQYKGGKMQLRIYAISAALLLAASAVRLAAQNQPSAIPTDPPPGHGIKCLKADGKTPCQNPEVADLNKDTKDLKTTFGDAKATAGDSKSAVDDSKQAVGDAQQTGADTKQTAADAKHPVANAKQGIGDAKQTGSDAKQTYGDAQQAYGDAQSAKSDAQSTGQDVKQNVQDVAQTAKDLKGIGSLALKALDGSMSCAQDNGSACNDDQTKALKSHAAQKTPPITVKREVDQPNN